MSDSPGKEAAVAPEATGASAISEAVGATAYSVSGTVTSPDRAGVNNLTVTLVDKNVGGDVSLASTMTDNLGRYSVTLTISLAALRARLKTQPDLQARVSIGDTFLGASDVSYNAPTVETLNITLPANSTALPSEYETLTGMLAAVYSGSLANLQENTNQQDITYLANKTGWDARAVALAALAAQFSQGSGSTETRETATKTIDPAFYYALFRAGLPANANSIYLADPQTVLTVWNQAISQGVIPSDLAGKTKDALAAYQSQSATQALGAIAFSGMSSMQDMLAVSLGHSAHRQQQFADLYTQNQGDMTTFWKSLESTFGAATTARLKLDGQLAYLTLNNAALMTNLHAAESTPPLTSPLDLVRRGYYDPSKWTALLENEVPEQIPGSTIDEQVSNYAALLTAQLRLAYPTAVLAEMVNANTVPLTQDAGIRQEVYTFLTQNQGSYEIGVQPLDQYLSANNQKLDPNAVTQIKRLQRVFQITPSDTAMNALLSANVDSAYQIVHFGQTAFVRAFQAAMGGESVAQQTFAKAQSVYNTVLNLTTSYLTQRVTPTLGNGATYVGPFPGNNAALASQNTAVSATLETLFGSMDTCACDDCRSILSPAAYLVDLLNFTNCTSLPTSSANPQSVLFQRRPDLQYLPLTCDNTNTALPYIDIVNETLEYFAANGSLNGFQGFSTDDTVTSAELLASPQNINDAAYAALQSTRALFPPPLPFHRPLELLRLLFQQFNVNLQEAMAALRQSDAIERTSTDYGWRDILMEQIGLSRIEYQILTDSTLTLWQLYGYPALSDADTITALSSVQDYSRRLNVQYSDLISILETHFINPNSTLIPQLESLSVPFSTLQELQNGTLSSDAFLALLPTGNSAPVLADFGGDIVAWITDPTRYAQIMSLITIANPNQSTDLCTMANLEFRYSNPDNSANSLNPIDFLRMLRFMRLWQKIGVTIEQTDAVITALSPAIAKIVVGGTIAPNKIIKGTIAGASWQVKTRALLRGLPAPDALASDIAAAIRSATAEYSAFTVGPTVFVFSQSASAVSAIPLAANGAGSITLTVGTHNASDEQLLDGTFLVLLPRLGFAYQIVNRLGLTPAKDLEGLLACWAPISVYGADSLYSSMFLNPTLVPQDPAFAPDDDGNVLQDDTQMLLLHELALRGAFNLAAAEFAAICTALNYDATTPLTLANITAVYQRGWLARAMGISVVELLLLIQYTGLNPFLPPDPAPTSPAEPPIIRLIRIVQVMSAAALQPTQALYLIWNQDISGTSAPTDAEITALAYTLRADFAAVDSQFAVVDDPTGSIAESLVALVYGTNTASFFFGLLNSTFSVSVAYGGAVPAAALTAYSNLTYDDYAKQLTYSGYLNGTAYTTIQTAAAGNAAFLAALVDLQAASQAAVNPLFTQYPGLRNAYQLYVNSGDTLQNWLPALLAILLPIIEPQRKQEQALASVSAAAAVDISFANAVFNSASVLQSANDATQPAVIDLTAIETEGLSVKFFLTNNTTAPPDQAFDNVTSLSYAPNTANALPAGTGGSAIAGIWSGYLDVPQDGFYNFSITTDTNAVAALTIGGTPVLITGINPTPTSPNPNVWTNTSPVSLTAGSPSQIVLTVTNLTSTLAVNWQSPILGLQAIPNQYAYSQTLVNNMRTSYTRFLKAESLATSLSLNADELAFLAQAADYQVQGRGWLNSLAVSGGPAPALYDALRNVLTGVLTFASLKSTLSPKDERLLAVIENPDLTLPSNTNAPPTPNGALLALTGWDQDSLNDLLSQFFGSGDVSKLSHIENFRRVYDAYAVVTACGIDAKTLLSATTNDPMASTVSNFQSAVRARYAQADWLALIQPVSDTMREAQRDALVPYVLQLAAAQAPPAVVDINTPVNTPDTLYEYLLMDVEMGACMTTSRIQNALACVQLFIERCLRSLELNTTDPTRNVDPGSFDPSIWTWMKRYRVWQANREVFLWPENWLYPELRDDQSPFFTTIMSKLLQNDITDDAATYAYLEYLSDLEVVAKLEPCGIYYVPNASSPSSSAAHVIARTSGANRAYYYRYFDGASWGPWEQIPLNIEDNPVLPVVWNNRLMLFWLQVVQQPAPNSGANVQSAGNPPTGTPLTSLGVGDLGNVTQAVSQSAPPYVTIQLNLFWSEYYNGKWHPAKSSDTNNPATFSTFPSSGQFVQFDRSQLQLAAQPDTTPDPTQDRLWLLVSGQGNANFLFYNTHSAPIANAPGFTPVSSLYDRDVEPSTPEASPVTLSIGYLRNPAGVILPSFISNQLLTTLAAPIVAETVVPEHPMQADTTGVDWTAPFFFADTCNAFYVQTTKTQTFVQEYLSYGITPFASPFTAQWAPLVLKNAMALANQLPPREPITISEGIGSVDSAAITQYIGVNPYIARGLVTTSPVAFGDAQIGVSGSIDAQNTASDVTSGETS